VRDRMTRAARRMLVPVVVLSLAGCSGSAHGKASGPIASHAAATVAGGSVNAGRACTPKHFRLESLSTASGQAHRLVARMSLSQEVVLMRGAGLNGGTAGTAASTEPIPALKVPALNQEDGPAGVADSDTGVTQLPAPIALAATFDPAAARCYGQVIGGEARRKGIQLIYGPTVNLVRVPQWGRAYESFGEDPDLSGTVAAAEIDGMQRTGVMAEVKHFAVYNQETYRNTPADDAIVASRTLQEIYLKLWRSVAAADPAAIMCAYSTINGRPACQDGPLIRGFLDRQLGFTGFVSSDFMGTHSTVASAKAGLDQEQPSPMYFGKPLIAAVRQGRLARSIVDQAAVRILTQIYRFRLFSDYPIAAPHRDVATAGDAQVARTVAEQGTVLLKNINGVLPLAGSGSVAVIGPAASSATTSAGDGTTTVLSPGTVTPLHGLQAAAPAGVTVTYTAGLPATAALTPIPSPDLQPAYPVTGSSGPFSATLTAPQGGTYVFGLTPDTAYQPVSLSIDGVPLLIDPGSPPVSTYTAAVHFAAGTTHRLSISGPSNVLTWATPGVINHQIAAAATAASHATTAVVVVADDQESEAADRASLTLPSAQDQLVRAVAAANSHTVVVIEAGAAVAMPWLSKVGAVVDQWYAGESDGTSLAAVLFGAVDPSGHLPITFPASMTQTPVSTTRQFPGRHGRVHYSEGVNIGYRWWIDTHHRPLFPFGFGLSYTTFHYARPVVRVSLRGRSPVVSVREVVTNTGHRSGADVAQLYLGLPASVGEPARQLEGYQRVSLAAGHSATVSFRLRGLQLSDFAAGRWQIPAGTFRLYIGDSCAARQLVAPVTFRLTRPDRP
jgi:beta-glucosidase